MTSTASSDARLPVVLLAGNPNAGKTTLFNALTGARARTGNYPGVTVERRVGRWALPETIGKTKQVELVDLPGSYSLTTRSREEAVAIEAILPEASANAPSAIVVVADSSTLQRHLYFAVQVLEVGLPTVLALNLADEAEAAGVQIDVASLSAKLGCPVVSVSARAGTGLPALAEALAATLEKAAVPLPISLELDADSEVCVTSLESVIDPDGKRTPAHRRVLAMLALLSTPESDEDGIVPPPVRKAVEEARTRCPAIEQQIISARYARVDALLDGVVTRAERKGPSFTERVDGALTHPVLGLLVFFVVMAALFQALFAWSEPLVSFVESSVAGLQDLTRAILPEGPLVDLLVEGVIAGGGNVVVFVPQIAILSLFLIVLEDTGYLARVALVIDRLMGSVGLHGRAFVPLLSGFACAVPAVIATRTIENRRDRLLTMLALPLMSCSARLPVYILVVAVAFPANGSWMGLSTGAIALLSMYALSVVTTLSAAAIMRRTVLKGPRPTMILELPPYRLPVLRNLLRATWDRTWQFLVNAGTVIVAITIVLWALLNLPGSPEAVAAHDVAVAEAESSLEGDALDARVFELDSQLAETEMERSIGGTIGRFMEPAIAPLGFDWKIGVGLLASFAAREVLVSTLGIVYGVGDEADEASEPLRDRLRGARRPDGTPVFTPLVGVSLMVFFVLAAQCMSTLAIVRRESGSWKWALFMLTYMNTLAYVASLAVYQGGLLLGLG
jgi:ferrous iron transport protein B